MVAVIALLAGVVVLRVGNISIDIYLTITNHWPREFDTGSVLKVMS